MAGEHRGQQLVRAYARAIELRARLAGALNACFDGFWLGLMDRNTLALLDQSFYESRRESVAGQSYAYDDTYNLLGIYDWEAAAVDEHFPRGGRVVVTGAGTGREVFGLLERGFDAVGYEPNGRLRELGADFLRRHGHPDRLHPIERDVFPAAAGRCDAVVVGWGSYMLIPGRLRRVAFLRSARQSLPGGAPLLVSFFTRSNHVPYFRTVAATANPLRRLRRLEPAEVGDILDPEYLHAFTRAEIEGELDAGGFRMVGFEEKPYPHAVGRAR